MDSRLKVYTGGTFDLFHAGHALFLKNCAVLGDVTVSLNTDEFIEEYKGHKPVISYADREKVLRSCKYVKDVIPNVGGADSKIAIMRVKPQVVAIGTDWVGKDYYKQMSFTQEWLDEQGIVLVYIAYAPYISSTKIRERMK